MPRRTYDDLLRALGRGELAPVYYLYGSEDILKEEAARAIVDKALEPHERDFNLDQRVAASLDPEQLHALVNTLPMMAARRCVVIREIEAWRKKAGPRDVLLKYLQNPSADTVLVLQESAPNEEKERNWEPDDAIADRVWSVDFAPLPPDRVPKWVAHHAKRLGIIFGEGAAEHLATACGYELGALRSELEKLAGLADGEPLSRELVGDLVGVRHGETLEDWVDAVLADHTTKALELTERVLGQSGMTGVRMITSLGTGLIGLQLARALHDKGTRGGSLERAIFERFLKLRPFGLGDWKALARNWSRWAETWPAARIRAALRVTLEADTALKGTRISDDLGVMQGVVLQAAKRQSGKAASGTASAERMSLLNK
ncbi:MAG TPA: DNA polymerase III subunit delta [Gemmatimonadales bacterium]|nr:DNA polymerase III subunit delta [Gemmatimonadales bacterium]